MIHDFVFLYLRTDAEQVGHFLAVVKNNPVGLDLGPVRETAAKFARAFGIIERIGFVDVQNQFVNVERVVIVLAQFQLPRRQVLRIVQHVFEDVEINQRSFDFIEPHGFDFRYAGNISDQARNVAMTMWTGFVNQTAINQIAGAITQHDASARIERGENDFTGRAGRLNRAGFWIDNFNDSEIGIKMIAGLLIERARALRPRHFGFGEAIRGDDIDRFRAQRGGEPGQFAARAGRHFFAAQNDSAKVGALDAFVHGLLQDVIQEGRHADDYLRLQLADETQLAIRAEDFPAAAAKHKIREFHAAVVSEPKSQVRRVRERIQQPKIRLGVADFKNAFASQREVGQVEIA